jgi:hypothetical protein
MKHRNLRGQKTVKARGHKKGRNDFAAQVGRALRRAAKAARKTARMYGTPIYILRDGKIVAGKP